MDAQFDHDRHCALLEQAEQELRNNGHEALAGAVMRAVMIHREFQTRHMNAVTQLQRLRKRIGELHVAERGLSTFIKPDGPWVGPDLFPTIDGE